MNGISSVVRGQTASWRSLEGYLHAYTTALKDKPTADRPFRKAFIDAFAGTGYREIRRDDGDSKQQSLEFPDLAGEEPSNSSMAPRGSRSEPSRHSTSTSSSSRVQRAALSSRG